MNEHEQEGYDAWIAIWIAEGYPPNFTACPGRWMGEGKERDSYYRGWMRADREHTGEQHEYR